MLVATAIGMFDTLDDADSFCVGKEKRMKRGPGRGAPS